MSRHFSSGILGWFGIFTALVTASHAEEGERSGWTVTAGAQVRRIDVGFRFDTPSPLALRGLFSRRSDVGPGDVGVVTNGSDIITYLDGTVGPNLNPVRDRDSSFSVDSTAQVVFGLQPPGADFSTAGQVTFHSTGTTYDYPDQLQSNPFSVDDSEVVVSPFLELQKNLFEEEGLSVDFVVGWSYLESELGGGPRTIATRTITERRTDSQYTYLYSLPSASGPLGFPLVYSNAAMNGVIYDADDYNAFGGFGPGDPEYVMDPQTLAANQISNRPVATLTAVSSVDLDVDAHVFPFLLEVRREISPGTFFSAGAGPTLNVISHDFETRTDWYLNGTPLATVRDSDSGTDLVMGASVRTALSVVLDEEGSLLFEVGGGYDWVPTRTVAAGNAVAEIDLGSWVGTFGFVKHF
ncbi:MAG: hypothetical protein KDN18_22415 [Verrucomicrobiae bacterium]|nr:hypothetical protein [Verrucomicrobiae bacterium]